MSNEIEAMVALIFLLINLVEPVFGVSNVLSYLHYFSYTPTTNTTQLTNQITGEAIALPGVILTEIIDGLVSAPLGILAAMLLDLASGGSGGGGGRTVRFGDGRVVTFRHK